MQSQIWQTDLGKPLDIMVIQVYAPTSYTEEAEVEHFNENLPFRTNTPKKMTNLDSILKIKDSVCWQKSV